MLFKYCFVLTILLYFGFIEGFFLLEDKEPLFFCYKICPLYCSSRQRRDADASSFIYDDDDLPPFIYDHEPEIVVPYGFSHSYFCKPSPAPTTTTTTMKTTTPEPTLICELCMKKCHKKND